jgi:transcriptional regulator
MYAPFPFNLEDPKKIREFLQEHPFGTLIQSGDAEPIATHLPFEIRIQEDEIMLISHIAKNNPQSALIRNGKKALVTFLGPHGYISSSVYGHPNVPTWNYQAVHVNGVIETLSEEELNDHLNRMVNQHESGREEKLDLSKLPKEMLNSYRQEIIAFKIIPYRIEAAFKLSQNRNKEDHSAILKDLEKTSQHSALVNAMKKHR